MVLRSCRVVPNGVRRHVSELAASTVNDCQNPQMAGRPKIPNNRNADPVGVASHATGGQAVTGLCQINAAFCAAVATRSLIRKALAWAASDSLPPCRQCPWPEEGVALQRGSAARRGRKIRWVRLASPTSVPVLWAEGFGHMRRTLADRRRLSHGRHRRFTWTPGRHPFAVLASELDQYRAVHCSRR